MTEEIKIGKEAFEKYINSSMNVAYNNIYAILSVANKYNLSLEKVYEYLTLYYNNKVEPKPSEEEKIKFKLFISRNQTDLNEIVNNVLQADTDEKLKRIMNKYDENTLRNTLIVFAFNVLPEEREEKHKTISERLEQIDKIKKESKNNSTTIKYSEEEIRKIIVEYLNSEEIYPDVFITKQSSSSRILPFKNMVLTFIKKNEMNKALGEKFLNTLNERIAYFLETTDILFDITKSSKITSLDIEMATGLSLKKFRMYIQKNDFIQKYSMSTRSELSKIVDASIVDYDKEISKEEAYNEVLSYKKVPMEKEDVDYIYAFFNMYNINKNLSNLRAAFIKLIDYDLVPTYQLRYLNIAKDAFNTYIKNGGSSASVIELSNLYKMTFDEIHNAIRFYANRFISPKPTEDELKAYKVLNSRHKYGVLEHVISAITSAKTISDLEIIVNKYEWLAIKNSIEDYVYKKPEKDRTDIDKQLLDAYEWMITYRAKKPVGKSQVEINQDNVDAIIEEYLNSTETFPDDIIAKYYKNVRSFGTYLETYASRSTENRKKADLYLKVRTERINEFAIKVPDIISGVQKNTLNPLDIQLITGMNLNKFKLVINKKEIVDCVGHKSAIIAFSKYLSIKAGDMRKYTLEDALNLKYSYENHEMTKEDIKEIYDFLTVHNLPTTYSNICFAFNKKVNGTLINNQVNKK